MEGQHPNDEELYPIAVLIDELKVRTSRVPSLSFSIYADRSE